MNTILKYTFAIALLTFTLNTHANTNTTPKLSELTEEAYIDDIPFSTETIFDGLIDLSINNTYELTEEAYIQDIPFNTKEMVESTLELTNNIFYLEEESYIDDLPFSTEAMVNQ